MTKVSKILVAVDPTAEDQPAVARGAWLAEHFDASLELFICDYDQYLSGERFFDTEALAKARDHIIESDRRRLEALLDTVDSNISVAIDARWDHPLEEGILRKAQDSGASILVKDTHYHSAIRRSIFSNTDWNLIRACPIPLLLVKSRAIKEKPTVIAAVDPLHEKDQPAALDHEILDWANALAKRTAGRLHVFHSFDPAPAYAISADSMAFPISTPINAMTEAMQEQHDKAMSTLLAQRDGDEFETHLLEGGVRDELIGLVQELRADFVVMGAVSRNALQRLFLGSTAESVLDHVPCDLLIVKMRAGR